MTTTAHEPCTAPVLATLTASKDGRTATFDLHSCGAPIFRFAGGGGGILGQIDGCEDLTPEEARPVLAAFIDGDGWEVA